MKEMKKKSKELQCYICGNKYVIDKLIPTNYLLVLIKSNAEATSYTNFSNIESPYSNRRFLLYKYSQRCKFKSPLSRFFAKFCFNCFQCFVYALLFSVE